MVMLKGYLLVVSDMNKAISFYTNLLGLSVIHDNDGNVELSGGVYLQQKDYWEGFLKTEVIPYSNSSELYFETEDFDGFLKKLENYGEAIKYVNEPMTHSWGQRVVRFYDLDGNLIEVGSRFPSF